MKKEVVCLGHTITLHDASGDYDLMEALSLPNVPGPPPHYHSGYNEKFFVIEGQLEFMVNGTVTTLETGNSIDVPANTLHTFNNVGDVPCRFLNVHSPKGFAAFFEKFGVNADEPDAFQKSVDGQVINNVLQQAASYDMHIQLP